MPARGATARGTVRPPEAMCARYVVRCVWGLRGAPEQAALRLWYVHSTQEAGTRRPYEQYGGAGACVSAERRADLRLGELEVDRLARGEAAHLLVGLQGVLVVDEVLLALLGVPIPDGWWVGVRVRLGYTGTSGSEALLSVPSATARRVAVRGATIALRRATVCLNSISSPASPMIPTEKPWLGFGG